MIQVKFYNAPNAESTNSPRFVPMTEALVSAIVFGSSAVCFTLWMKKYREIPPNRPTRPMITSSASLVSSPSVESTSSSMHLVRHLSAYSNWSEYGDDEETFIRDFPKVELHVHLDGTFDTDFLWNYIKMNPESVYCLPVRVTPPWNPEKDLYIRQNVMDCKSSNDFRKLCTCRGYRSLAEMLNCFEVFLPIVRGNLVLIEQLAYDFCQRQWEQNVVYCEVRYSAHLLAEEFAELNSNVRLNKEKVTPQAVFDAVTRGLRRGCQQFVNLTVNQILCGISWRPEWAVSTLDMATNHQFDFPCAVVGVDIAAGEEHFDAKNYPDLHGPFFAMAQEAKRRNIPLTLHAGEMTSDNAIDNVRRAIMEYGARRIGHGYRMTESMAIMNIVRSNDVHVEVCPTSSVETGGWIYDNENMNRDWTNHPAITMLRHGISLSFSSDDPAVFHTSLSWQYRIAIAKMSLSLLDLWCMNLNAVSASWCSREEKDRLTELIHCYGQVKGFDLCKVNYHNHNRQISHFSWWKTKTDSFLDRVYLRDEDVKV